MLAKAYTTAYMRGLQDAQADVEQNGLTHTKRVFNHESVMSATNILRGADADYYIAYADFLLSRQAIYNSNKEVLCWPSQY